MTTHDVTGPSLTRAEQRAFVLALLDVPAEQWWWKVIISTAFPAPVRALISVANECDMAADERRRFGVDANSAEDMRRACIEAAADLLRPRYTLWDTRAALYAYVSEVRSGNPSAVKMNSARERIVRMVLGEEE